MEVRELKSEDRPDIIEICKTVYLGNDFVPKKMDHWIAAREWGKHYPFVVLVDGNIAAITNIKVMDKGITAWIEGLRVHPNFRGKGIATFVNKWCMQYAREKLNLKRARYTTDASNTPATSLAKATGLSIVSTMVLFYLPAPFDDYPFPACSYGADDVPSLQKLDVPSFTALVRAMTKEERENLIPLDSVVIEWTTFDAFDLEQAEQECTFEIWVHIKDEKLASFTLVAVMEVMAGIKSVPSVYCTNLDDLAFHVNHFLQLAVQNNNSLFDLKICVNKELTYPVLCEYFGSQTLGQLLLWERTL